MRKIPPSLLKEILADPYYKKCAVAFRGGCKGRITIEHAIIYAGRQVNEKWGLVPICAYHHEVDQYQDGGGMNKELNMMVALNRATDEDLDKMAGGDKTKSAYYKQQRKYLNEKYHHGSTD